MSDDEMRDDFNTEDATEDEEMGLLDEDEDDSLDDEDDLESNGFHEEEEGY